MDTQGRSGAHHLLDKYLHISTMYEAVSASNVTVVDAGVTGFTEQKIKYWPSDEYLFVVEVFWSDKTTTYIKRTYRDFENLTDILKQHFLSRYQTGIIKTPIYIPFIQGRKLFQKNSRELAEERETELHNFLKQLIPGNVLVTSNSIVLEFFKSRHTDPTPNREPTGETINHNNDDDSEDDEDVLFDK